MNILYNVPFTCSHCWHTMVKLKYDNVPPMNMLKQHKKIVWPSIKYFLILSMSWEPQKALSDSCDTFEGHM